MSCGVSLYVAFAAASPASAASSGRPAGTGDIWGAVQNAAASPIGVFGSPGDALDSVSCASAGNCSVGGYYTDASGWDVFVVNEVDGRWGTAEQVPGTSPF